MKPRLDVFDRFALRCTPAARRLRRLSSVLRRWVLGRWVFGGLLLGGLLFVGWAVVRWAVGWAGLLGVGLVSVGWLVLGGCIALLGVGACCVLVRACCVC